VNAGQPVPAPLFDIVAIAASAGGLRAISALLEFMPAEFPIPLAVVQHLDPHHRSLLVQILARRTRLQVAQAEDGLRLRAGWVYVAPPDQHFLVNADMTATLTRTELVHFVRPSADLLFESVAAAFGQRALAVVMSGTGRDGSMGVQAVKKMGGTVIVEDPATAEFAGMPEAAVRTDSADWIISLADIGPTIQRLVRQELKA
jgi:two-component system, chemotaxis family, protein-glutamate methylesterase/glutaminase